MAVSDEVLERAWDLWSRAWDPKDRDIGVYKLAFKDLTDERLREAAMLAISECRFFPAPYDIIRLAPPDHSRDAVQVTRLAGFRPAGSMEVAALRQHRLRCEAWFGAVQAALNGSGPLIDADGGERIAETATANGWLGVAGKLIATQYLLCKREINLRESFEENPECAEQGNANQMGLEMGTNGVLQQLHEDTPRSVGVRSDSGASGLPPTSDPMHEPQQYGGAKDEDAGHSGVGHVVRSRVWPFRVGVGSGGAGESKDRTTDSHSKTQDRGDEA